MWGGGGGWHTVIGTLRHTVIIVPFRNVIIHASIAMRRYEYVGHSFWKKLCKSRNKIFPKSQDDLRISIQSSLCGKVNLTNCVERALEISRGNYYIFCRVDVRGQKYVFRPILRLIWPDSHEVFWPTQTAEMHGLKKE